VGDSAEWGYKSVKSVKYKQKAYDAYVAGLEEQQLLQRDETIRPTEPHELEMKRAGIGASKAKKPALGSPQAQPANRCL
jgi:predicted transcriptional regulator